MADNVFFLTSIILVILLSCFNIFYYKFGKTKFAHQNRKIKLIRIILLILILILICLISKLRYQVDALLISLVVFFMPLSEINFEEFLKNKKIELLLVSIIFLVVVVISTYLLVSNFL